MRRTVLAAAVLAAVRGFVVTRSSGRRGFFSSESSSDWTCADDVLAAVEILHEFDRKDQAHATHADRFRAAQAPAPTSAELVRQVSVLKKQLGEVQLEAVRCQELELGAAALQQEVASLREELARSEERGREERKQHCAAQVGKLVRLGLPTYHPLVK